ncbi:MAG: hypothetical protein JSW28_09235, partial [Thermoplasmata archaeon]
KGYICLVTVLLIFVMVTATFSHVLGGTQKPGTQKIGYVETQGDLVTYNVDGVQMEDVEDQGQREKIIFTIQENIDWHILGGELANKDMEATGRYDYRFNETQYNLINMGPDVMTASFDNGNLDRKSTGGRTDISHITMLTLKFRSVNDNDIHMTFAFGDGQDEVIVAGMVTNNYGTIDDEGLEKQVYYIHCYVIIRHIPVYWRIWWYDSHHHPNWFYGWYFWYWRYHFYYHYIWYPWFTWWWGGWYYWRYWGYWSTYWPYYYYIR